MDNHTLEELGAPAIGTRIDGRYRLDVVIAQGGMGMIYEAEDTELGRTVAVKVLPAVVKANRARERFIREAKLTAAIMHPNVVSIYDAGFVDAMPYLVMQRLVGQTLDAHLRVKGLLRVRETLAVANQILAALEAAHEAHVLHRDVKPANVFLTTQPNVGVVLFDFGLGITMRVKHTLRLTDQGVVVGTPSYMAPEQVIGQDADVRTDLYGAGAAIYEALVGRRPIGHEETSVSRIFDAIIDETPVRPSVLRPSVPEDISSWVMRALTKDPDDRYQKASEMREVCKRLLRAMPS